MIDVKDPEEIVDFIRDIAISLQDGAREAIFLGADTVYLTCSSAVAIAKDLNRIAQEVESWHASE